MKKVSFRFLLVWFFCLCLSVSAYAGGTIDPTQFPYPATTANYYGTDCWADVYAWGFLQAGDSYTSDGFFYVYATDFNRLVNTSSMISARESHGLYFHFYDSVENNIWYGSVLDSSVEYNANADRIKIVLKINDASLQSAAGGSYSQISAILSSSWLKLKGENWIGTCTAPRGD